MKSRGKVKTNRGRKTILNASLQRKICDLFERGHTVATVAQACGFSERSFFNWCQENSAFFAETQRARATGRLQIVESILKHPDWRAKAWFLERTDPAQFGRTAERPGPEEPERDPPRVTYIIQTSDGNQRQVTIEEAANLYSYPTRVVKAQEAAADELHESDDVN